MTLRKARLATLLVVTLTVAALTAGCGTSPVAAPTTADTSVNNADPRTARDPHQIGFEYAQQLAARHATDDAWLDLLTDTAVVKDLNVPNTPAN